ncbi:hypothetical protein Pmani_028466 [Petrolisthes manimaculis]|uniref:Uncharacterized protein n=1 Tax=Petrolisthes manimaculis TaxID=1843537 RepID=A0AAE1P1H6_9EUCA|nr:hypothetical protein Pmani_028466 [Petrolisthes manimaculis]
MKQIPQGHKVRTGAQGDDKQCQRVSDSDLLVQKTVVDCCDEWFRKAAAANTRLRLAHTHSKRQQQQQQHTTVDEILPVRLPDTHLALDSDGARLDWYGERVGGKAASERGRARAEQHTPHTQLGGRRGPH